MDNHLSISLKHLSALILLTIIISVAFSTALMFLGWLLATKTNQLEVSPGSAKIEQPTSPSDSRVDLPRALTATPREKQAKTISFTNESLLVELQKQVAGSSTPVEFEVQSVVISEECVRLTGWIGGLDWRGPVEVSGVPGIIDGMLQFTLQDLLLADQPLPASMSAAVETEIQDVFKQWLWGYEILEIKLEEGKIDLSVVDW